MELSKLAAQRKLVANIVKAHKRTQHYERMSEALAQHAIKWALQTGMLLDNARKMNTAADWENWLKEKCNGMSLKTAERYVNFAKALSVPALHPESRDTHVALSSSLHQAFIVTGVVKPTSIDKPPRK